MACEERDGVCVCVCVAYQLNFYFFIGVYTLALTGKRIIQIFNYLTIYFHGARLILWLPMLSGKSNRKKSSYKISHNNGRHNS
jgi:hypothetical protein